MTSFENNNFYLHIFQFSHFRLLEDIRNENLYHIEFDINVNLGSGKKFLWHIIIASKRIVTFPMHVRALKQAANDVESEYSVVSKTIHH